MPWIGIEDQHGLVYEGLRGYGQAVWPSPFTAPAALIAAAEFPPRLPAGNMLEHAELLFREDSFDAATRVRRGRLYKAAGERPAIWRVYQHPMRPSESSPHFAGAVLEKRIYGFEPMAVPRRVSEIHASGGRPLVVIGTETSYTIWTLTAMESLATADYLLTLRGRQTFGALPELNLQAIPEPHRRGLVSAVARLSDDLFRAGPDSVVDRAREVAATALSAYLQNLNAIGAGRELDELVKKLSNLDDPHNKRVAGAGAEIVRIFHSRGKTSVRERIPDLPPLREQDAELAVGCVGSLLCELGWADWA